MSKEGEFTISDLVLLRTGTGYKLSFETSRELSAIELKSVLEVAKSTVMDDGGISEAAPILPPKVGIKY